ncbi:hypothetical protein P3T76_015982 [Phytophthora citrophthora]|uniref:Uncharacterized protein n=1 Tax=Phytophthora citrophthora TaxID=4793 RepID=A0AAD9FYU2_9STRA|nr:hypothetical protein P3T76_015982 [Phytophthora citrophthora]
MVPDRSRRRRRLATLVVRRPAQRAADSDTWTSRGERVLTLPTEQPNDGPGTTTATDRANATTVRLLLAHAHRTRHLLADRAVLANVHSTRREELMQEIQRMRDVMRTLENQIEVTTRSLESMERLVAHLQRVSDLVGGTGVQPTVTRDAPATSAEASIITTSTTSAS